MSDIIPCVPCCATTTTTNIPGAPGLNGADGAAGISSFCILVAEMNPVPPDGGSTGNIAFSGSGTSWMVLGQTVIIGQGLTSPALANPGPFTFIVTAIADATHATLERVASPTDDTTLIISAGATCAPVGHPAVLAAALPTVLTDNSTGVPTNTIAAGTGKFTLSIYFRAAAITGNVLLYTYTPGFAFKILRISASVVDAITTGAKAATLTTAINATPTTGGIVIMSGAYALGAEQASSAAITALNTGTSAHAITVTASAVTAFIEGGFLLNMEIQNMDTANAVASLSDHVNDVIAALTF